MKVKFETSIVKNAEICSFEALVHFTSIVTFTYV